MNILLTGNKGVGKSTILNKILEDISTNTKLLVGGFTIEKKIDYDGDIEIRNFYIKSLLDGEIRKISTNKVTEDHWEINPYLNEFNLFSKNLLKSLDLCDLLVVDEIGFLEASCVEYVESLNKVLDSCKLVLGVIRRKDCEFINKIKARDDVSVITVTNENRDNLVPEILLLLNN